MPAQKLAETEVALVYEILIQGVISQRWVDWMGNAEVVTTVGSAEPSVTSLVISVADQAALLGQLQQLHNLGLSLLRIRLSPDHTTEGE